MDSEDQLKRTYTTVEVEELICLPEFPLEINLEIDEHDENGSISPINFLNLLPQEDDAAETNITGKWYLIQQWNSIYCLKHNIVFIKDCDLHLNTVQVLYTTTNYEDAFQKWLSLWKHCFKMAYENSTVNVQEQEWFLLQLSTDDAIVTYEILEKNTFHMRYNLTMVNHPIYGVIYQMFDNYDAANSHKNHRFVHILRFAINDYKLGPHLQAMSLLGLNASIYLEPTLSTGIVSSEIENVDDQLIAEHLENHEKLQKTLEVLNEREAIAKQECNMLIDIMDKVRQMRIKLTATYKKKLKEMNRTDEEL